MPPTTLPAQLKSSTLAEKGVSDAAKARAAEEARAPAVGNQVVVVAPFTAPREVHKDRIGRVVSTKRNFYSVKFSDNSLVSFRASEFELAPTPTALSKSVHKELIQ